MKKYTIISLLLVSYFTLLAQVDTVTADSKNNIEQYCQVIATPVLFSNKVTISIDFGEQGAYLKDDRLRSTEGKLQKFNSVIDALNFMGREGWLFVNAYPVRMANTEIYHFAFRKLVRL